MPFQLAISIGVLSFKEFKMIKDFELPLIVKDRIDDLCKGNFVPLFYNSMYSEYNIWQYKISEKEFKNSIQDYIVGNGFKVKEYYNYFEIEQS